MTDIVDDLKDLLKQATTERSHYYVAATCKRAIEEIESLRTQWAEMAGKLLGKIGQTNEVMRDATDRIERLERRRS